MTEKLEQSYRKVLIQIGNSLNLEQQSQLVYYCTGSVLRCDLRLDSRSETLQLLRSLEDAAKVSWGDVGFLKECMNVIGREDLVAKLSAFEVTRELTILLSLYAEKTEGLDPFCRASTKSAAKCLIQLMKGFDEVINVTGILQSGLDENDLWRSFEEAIRDKKSPECWSDLAMLVAVAGEIIAVSPTKRSQEQIMEISVKGLAHSVAKLGNWQKFCDFVKQRYLAVCQQSLESDPVFLWRKQVDDVVKQLREAVFFH